MTPDEIFPGLKVNPDVVMLITCGLYPRRCYPCKWYGFTMRWQVHNYCKHMSRQLTYSNKSMTISLWLETEVGNDIFLGEWRNGKEVYLKDPSTVEHYKTGMRGIV